MWANIHPIGMWAETWCQQSLEIALFQSHPVQSKTLQWWKVLDWMTANRINKGVGRLDYWVLRHRIVLITPCLSSKCFASQFTCFFNWSRKYLLVWGGAWVSETFDKGLAQTIKHIFFLVLLIKNNNKTRSCLPSLISLQGSIETRLIHLYHLLYNLCWCFKPFKISQTRKLPLQPELALNTKTSVNC